MKKVQISDVELELSKKSWLSAWPMTSTLITHRPVLCWRTPRKTNVEECEHKLWQGVHAAAPSFDDQTRTRKRGGGSRPNIWLLLRISLETKLWGHGAVRSCQSRGHDRGRYRCSHVVIHHGLIWLDEWCGENQDTVAWSYHHHEKKNMLNYCLEIRIVHWQTLFLLLFCPVAQQFVDAWL